MSRRDGEIDDRPVEAQPGIEDATKNALETSGGLKQAQSQTKRNHRADPGYHAEKRHCQGGQSFTETRPVEANGRQKKKRHVE